MNGISILLVDDDKLLVEKLEKTMHWSTIGVEKVYTAFNIRQAKAILLENSIDLLVSDIDMPQGSGLELVEWIREEDMAVECVFLSSYANFSYAQMALKLSSRDYILKPTSNKNLENALSVIISEMEQERKESHSLRKGTVNFYWNEFLAMKCDEKEFLNKVIEYYPDNMKIRCISLLCWGKDFPEVSELIELFGMVEAGSRISGSEILLVSDVEKEPEDEQAAKDFGPKLGMSLADELGVFCGESYALTDIGLAIHELTEMRRHAVVGESGIVREGEFRKINHCYPSIHWDILGKELISEKNTNKTKEAILNLFETQYQKDGWRQEYLEQFKWDLYSMFDVVVKKLGYNIEEIFIPDEYRQYVEKAKASIVGTRKLINYMFSRLEGRMNQMESENNVVQKIKVYIDAHLQDNLSRATLSQQVYLSEDYIAKLFLKEEGISLSNYIATKRIEKAMDYLIKTDLSVSNIAMEVGYNNFSYFSKSFKDQNGCTPNEFRAKNKKDYQ